MQIHENYYSRYNLPGAPSRDNFHTKTMHNFSSCKNVTETCNMAMEWQFCDLSESEQY